MATHQGRGRPLVLIVEDQRELRHLYAEQLVLSGFDVIEAGDGAAALARTTEQSPDVVLMDLSLPGIDGWEATRRLKHDARTAHIPIVALTAHDGAGSRFARTAGAGATNSETASYRGGRLRGPAAARRTPAVARPSPIWALARSIGASSSETGRPPAA